MGSSKLVRKIAILAHILLLCMCLPAQLCARWLGVEDAPFESSYVQTIHVNGDGTYSMVMEIKRKILTEAGRTGVSNIGLYYNGNSQTVKVLEAKTIRDDKEYQLTKDLMEDKPLASSYDGFDQLRQLLLVFPKVEIGTTIYVKYRLVAKEPCLEKLFSQMFYFGDDELVTKAQVNITSKLPLHILVNDPQKILKISENKSTPYELNIILTKPIYNGAINEPSPFIVNDKYLTWVSVSSLNDWQQLAAQYGKLWTTAFMQDLPKDFEGIAKMAAGKASEIEKINTVTSLLNDKIRYMGDWRSIKGRYIPRRLDEISKTQFGDCKDFSAATAAILTKLGFKVQIAVVMRGIDKLSKNILPSFEAFNHAIVRIIGKNGRVYWIDPTNLESMADGIFPDIAAKTAIVLDPQQPICATIPAVDFKKAKVLLKRQWSIENNKINEVGELFAEKEDSLSATNLLLKYSPDIVKSAFFHFLADNKDVEQSNQKYMNLPKVSLREVKNINVSYGFIREDQLLTTNLGSALRVTYPEIITRICDLTQDVVSDVLLSGFPSAYRRITIIKDIDVKNVDKLSKEIKTSWIYAKRKYSQINRDLQIEDIIITYKNLIPNEDIKTAEFLKLKSWLESNFREVIVYTVPPL